MLLGEHKLEELKQVAESWTKGQDSDIAINEVRMAFLALDAVAEIEMLRGLIMNWAERIENTSNPVGIVEEMWDVLNKDLK